MKIKLKNLFKDISLTYVTEFIVLISFFYIYRLIGIYFGPKGVGEYSLIKKTISFLQPILLLGFGVGLPRYIAVSKNQKETNGYIKSSILMVTILSIIFIIVINLFSAGFSKLFLGSKSYDYLVLPISFLLIGGNIHNLIYSFFRGKFYVKTFNILQIINSALAPIIILLLFKNINIGKFIIFVGIANLMTSIVFYLFFNKDYFVGFKDLELKKSLIDLIKYSLPRLIGDFTLGAIISLGPILASHIADIEQVGYLSISQSLLNSVGVAIAPLGLILLPKVSNLITSGRESELNENLNILIISVIQLSMFISMQMIIFSDAIIKYWLGNNFIKAIPLMKIIFSSITFYSFYISMRSILDASKIKPLNTINLLISLAFFLIFSVIFMLFKLNSKIIILATSLSISLGILGILTYFSVRKIYKGNYLKDFNSFIVAILINFVLCGLISLIKRFIISNILYIIITEILAAIIYLVILWLLKMDWIRKIIKLIKY